MCSIYCRLYYCAIAVVGHIENYVLRCVALSVDHHHALGSDFRTLARLHGRHECVFVLLVTAGENPSAYAVCTHTHISQFMHAHQWCRHQHRRGARVNRGNTQCATRNTLTHTHTQIKHARTRIACRFRAFGTSTWKMCARVEISFSAPYVNHN